MNKPETVNAGTIGSSDLLGVNRVGNAILCVAWGEQDRPDATLARTSDDVRQFIVGEWIGDKDDPLVAEVMQELAAHDWREDGELKYEFEIGGVTFQDVVDVTPIHKTEAVIEGLKAGLSVAEHCDMNCTYHKRVMNEALALVTPNI